MNKYKKSDASLLVIGLFYIYEHRAKPATETKRSVVEVVHGGADGGEEREFILVSGYFLLI